jgi:hypothetical protein
MKTIEKLQLEHDNFLKVQSKLSKYGATDSEPDGVYQWEVSKAIKGLPFKPLTADGWQLYTCGMKCDGAAKRLNHALQKVVNVISCAPLSEQPNLIEWFKTWAWRVDI